MKILVIGAGTQLSSVVTRALIELEHEVHYFDCDVSNKSQLESMLEGVQAAYFMQTEDHTIEYSLKYPRDTLNELQIFLEFLDLARKHQVPRVVYGSSAAVYGAMGSSIPLNEFSSITAPMSPLGVLHMAMDMYAEIYYKLYRVRSIGLRYFNIYGPTLGGVVSKFIRAGMQDLPIVLYGDGEQARNFTYSKDAVKVTIAALTGEQGFNNFHGVLNVGNRLNPSTTLNDLIKLMNGLLPTLITVQRQDSRPGDMRTVVPDLAMLDSIYSFTPTTLEDGIKEMLA